MPASRSWAPGQGYAVVPPSHSHPAHVPQPHPILFPWRDTAQGTCATLALVFSGGHSKWPWQIQMSTPGQCGFISSFLLQTTPKLPTAASIFFLGHYCTCFLCLVVHSLARVNSGFSDIHRLYQLNFHFSYPGTRGAMKNYEKLFISPNPSWMKPEAPNIICV